MLPSAYMTERQTFIWNMNRHGITQAEIGRRIGATRQAVYDALKISQGKVDSALRHAAEVNMIETNYVDPINGILLGFSPSTQTRAIVTFSIKHGIQTWHYENVECPRCTWSDRCKGRLLDEAEERNISLTNEEKALPPSKLAHVIFSGLIPGLEP
jgi:DNA-binding XRE family transcriptional regulator